MRELKRQLLIVPQRNKILRASIWQKLTITTVPSRALNFPASFLPENFSPEPFIEFSPIVCSSVSAAVAANIIRCRNLKNTSAGIYRVLACLGNIFMKIIHFVFTLITKK